MKANMGYVDRALRILVAAIILAVYYQGKIEGTYAIIALIFAGIFIITGVVSFCPLYFPFKINTKRKSS